MTAASHDVEDLARLVVEHGFRLHAEIGPGLLESAYEAFLAASLREAGIAVSRQLLLPARYRGLTIENAFRVDLLVGDNLVVELKSVEALSKVHAKQLLTYLRMMDLPLGLLLNFGAPLMKDGLKRVLNDRHQHIGKFRSR